MLVHKKLVFSCNKSKIIARCFEEQIIEAALESWLLRQYDIDILPPHTQRFLTEQVLYLLHYWTVIRDHKSYKTMRHYACAWSESTVRLMRLGNVNSRSCR